MGMEFGHRSEFSEQSAAAIDVEVKYIVDECYLRAQRILAEHRAQLNAVAEALLERDTLSRTEFEAVMRGETLPPETVKPIVADVETADIPTPAYKPTVSTGVEDSSDTEPFIDP